MTYHKTKIIFAFILFTAFVTPSIASASVLPAIRQNLNESVNRLIEARDGDNTNISSEQNNLTHRKKVISDVLALSLQEIISVRNRLSSINIERESPSWIIREIILQWISSEEKYFEEIRIRLDSATNLDEVKALAREMQNHRNESFNANLANALDFVFILRTLRLTDVAANRWNKINTDLQRIERAGLIRVNAFAPQMSEAKERIDEAQALADESFALIKDIYLPTKEETLNPLATEISQNDEVIENKQKSPSVRELCEAAMDNLKLGYDEFVKISTAVRRLLRLP